MEYNVEWDSRHAASNRPKHGVSLRSAIAVIPCLALLLSGTAQGQWLNMELQALMAAGGRQTERLTQLEARMVQEVRAAAPDLLALLRNGDYESADAAAFALQYAPDPNTALAPLLDGLGRFDGGLLPMALWRFLKTVM